VGDSGCQSAARKKLFQRCKELGLNRQERIDVAQLLLCRDINSFDDLDEEQIGRLLDAFHMAELLIEVMRQHGKIIDL